jgi:hypothetical protein
LAHSVAHLENKRLPSLTFRDAPVPAAIVPGEAYGELAMIYGNNRILTRRELHDLVWSRSVQKLAAELGISDRGLAKICPRHRVPSPP